MVFWLLIVHALSLLSAIVYIIFVAVSFYPTCFLMMLPTPSAVMNTTSSFGYLRCGKSTCVCFVLGSFRWLNLFALSSSYPFASSISSIIKSSSDVVVNHKISRIISIL